MAELPFLAAGNVTTKKKRGGKKQAQLYVQHGMKRMDLHPGVDALG